MVGLLQSFCRSLSSRLSQRIVAWVFLSIVTIELVILLPSYWLRRRQLLLQLERTSNQVLVAVKGNTMMDMASTEMLDDFEVLLEDGESSIVGAILYGASGNVIDAFGEQPTLTLPPDSDGKVFGQNADTENRYDILWPPQETQSTYTLVIRHNTASIQAELWRYVGSIIGLVIIVSGFVTLVAFIGLERILITPILHLRDDLSVAGDAVRQEMTPKLYSFSAKPRKRSDELGEVTKAFQDMFWQIRTEIRQRKAAEAELKVEQAKSDQLLRNMLPNAIAQQLKQHQGAIANRIDEATILFADIADFTGLAAQVSPIHLVNILNQIFSEFDRLAEHHKLEKIKTIGDAYMVVGGVTCPLDNPAQAVVEMALDMQTIIRQFKRQNGDIFQLRIGINTGPVVAGVIGLKKYSYDLWGDAVNIASRMESHGEIGKIHLSESTYEKIKGAYTVTPRGEIPIKGRGIMKTYFLLGRKLSSKPSLTSESKPESEIVLES